MCAVPKTSVRRSSAADVGVTKGAAYHHFPEGKKALFAAVFADVNVRWSPRSAVARTVPAPSGGCAAAVARISTSARLPSPGSC